MQASGPNYGLGASLGLLTQVDTDYSRTQVPSSATYSGWHIALIVVGCTIAVPAFVMAANMGARLGLVTAGIAFGCGCLILGVLASFTALAGQRSGLSAYMLGEFAFGRWGGRVANLVIACTLVGWFGVTSTIFGDAASLLGKNVIGVSLPEEIYVLIGGALIVGVSVAGFKGIDRLALALVPIMLAFLIYAAWMSFAKIDDWVTPSGGEPLTLPSAISAVVGSYIVGVTIQPDYSRFARSRKAALISAFLALAVSFPLILFCAAIPSIAFNEPDLLKVMTLLGIGVPAFLLLVLASWSSNVLSVYSGSLSLATLLQRTSLRALIVTVGALGTLLALFRVGDYLIDYLILLGISIPPISSIYIVEALLLRSAFDADALANRPRLVLRALSAWAAAVCVGYLAHRGWLTLTTVAALDSILVAALVSFVLHRFGPRSAKQLPKGTD